MEFLGELGIDVKLLVAQMVNFGILLWFLTKFLYKPIVNRIEKDESELKQVQLQKEELEREKKAFEQQKTSETSEIRKRSLKIIKEAQEIAKEIKKRAREESELEKKAVIKQIKVRLDEINHEEKPQKKSK